MLSSTDTEQAWGKLASSKAEEFYTAKPLDDLCCISKKDAENSRLLTEEQHNRIFKIITECKSSQIIY